jgi:hypothetical protein
MSDREWDVTRELILQSQADVRTLQDRGQLILGAGFAAAGLSIPIIGQAPDVGFALSLLLITFAYCWHMNLNADAASLAQVRDFLAEKANAETAGNPYRFEAIGKIGKGHPATLLTGLLPATVLIGFVISSGLNAFRGVHLTGVYMLPEWAAIVVWALVTLLCAVAFAAAGLSVSDYRETIQEELWGADPKYIRPSFARRAVTMLFKRDKQGWDKDRARDAQIATQP